MKDPWPKLSALTVCILGLYGLWVAVQHVL